MPLSDPEDLSDAEKNYRESSDEDFNPTSAPADESSSSSEDEAPEKPAKGKRKRKVPATDGLDSGDEATIEAAQKKKAKKHKGGEDSDEDEDDLMFSDDGGEGGLIKTRAQRKVEKTVRKPLARTDGATIDVDTLWAQMSAAPLRSLYPTHSTTQEPNTDEGENVAVDGVATAADVEQETDLVSIRKVYTFAGQRTTEEKQVPRSLLEQHLSDGWKTVETTAQASGDVETKEDGAELGEAKPKIRRPLRRPSRFDANPAGFVRTLPPEHQLTWPRKITATAEQENRPVLDAPKTARPEKAQKLNVVDKSRLDWTGFVDKEGIGEELATHGKTKEAYLGRMEFLAGVEARKEEERRRMKTAAAS